MILCESDTITYYPSSSNVTAPTASESVVLFDEIGDVIKSVRSRANNELLPHVLHMENVFKNSRRRLLKMDKVDGVLQSALNSEVSEVVPDDVDDDISEDSASNVDQDDGNAFDYF